MPETAARPAVAIADADSDARLLLLDLHDNVLVARTRIRAGEEIRVGGVMVTVDRDLPIGHKLARRAVAPGDKIVKYGAPIGSATAAIAIGGHVHVHNVKSDYTPTYHLDEARQHYADGA
ncbi:MAG: UxaA family hydrolase [Bauldia sp.]|nr:UxaA family hydrolase [Bauldia sp.]